jgi:glutamate N-acetyltransferase (EC 2.3.1.35)
MAVGLGSFPAIPNISGVRFAVVEAGIKKASRKDLVVFEIDKGASVAGVFTQNAFCAAPVRLCREHLLQSVPRYLVINTGNANAGTGKRGYQGALSTCESLASIVGCKVSEVLPFSTGVIGEPLPTDKIVDVLPNALASLDYGNWQDAGEGIMTTDTRPKGAYRQFEVNGKHYTVGGISKGAGMIRPNMATMLGYVFTDISIDQNVLQDLLKKRQIKALIALL